MIRQHGRLIRGRMVRFTRSSSVKHRSKRAVQLSTITMRERRGRVGTRQPATVDHQKTDRTPWAFGIPAPRSAHPVKDERLERGTGRGERPRCFLEMV